MACPYGGAVPNRFCGKDCVLCPQLSEGVGEHVIPSWYQNDLLGDAPFKSENAGREYLKCDGNLAVHSSLPGTRLSLVFRPRLYEQLAAVVADGYA